jgi:hypothetical protein
MLSVAGVEVEGNDWNQGGQAWAAYAAKLGLNGDEKHAAL